MVVRSLFLGEYHHVKSSALHRPDGLHHPKSLAVPDVQRPDGKPRWALGVEARQRRRYVQAVGAIGDRSGKFKWHPCLKPKDKKGRVKNRCIGFHRPIIFPSLPFKS